MKEISVYVFSDSEKSQVKALRVLGLPRAAAAVAVYLEANAEHSASQKQIGQATGLSQPEVSTGLRVLRRMGYVDIDRLQVSIRWIAQQLYEQTNTKLLAAFEACGGKQ